MTGTPQPPRQPPLCTAFVGSHRVAAGTLENVALAVKAFVEAGERAPVLIFDDETSEVIDVDVRGTEETVRRHVAQLAAARIGPTAATPPSPDAPRGPGRPRLGVVAREVTLLPRHWEWLNTQPGGASAALRRLVEHARRANAGKDRVRRAQEASYRFMSTMAGDEAGFEEATRALFAGRRELFEALVNAWPADVRDHLERLAAGAFADPASPPSSDARPNPGM